MITPAITAIVIAVLAALAFGGGFALSDWRMASQIQRLNSNNAVLSAANDQCATDIQSARMAMETLTATTAAREKNAARAMQGAATAAAKRTDNAKKIRALPPVAPAKQCEALAVEQIRYVQSRHQND
ncbi:hypothetical protein SAMN05216420_10440 [Nitrosospira sp. Nl5]|uniref:hypothetical protein n=1 Tax=Nitrosospira sp. Nl5 TaxID=200120 RepID=UPI00088E224D|nr:hypothetical protein [Nitrosospira sp. Nl5]SCY26458.1 hypothetical protein SAMN05216420_10440 [Nitrosospira sp. Nl5]